MARAAGPRPRRAPCALLLTPGASATRDHHALVAIDEVVSAQGVAVSRIDLPARRRPPVILDAVREGAADLARSARVDQARVVLGGRSMGGRMCSMAVAEGLPALGLALVSYPLHPPARPDKVRTDHFPELRVPCLFVSGTKDAFGTPAELSAAVEAIPGPVTLVWIDGGDHGLRGRDQEIAQAVAAWVLNLPR